MRSVPRAIAPLGWIGAAAVCLAAIACRDTPAAPTSLASGRWTGDGVCLTVAEPQCDLVAGCGHGRFPPPAVRSDGSFEVQGTYRIEVGPIGLDPPPPARFSGVLTNGVLTLTVVPSDARLRATYALRLTNGEGRCTVPCL